MSRSPCCWRFGSSNAGRAIATRAGADATIALGPLTLGAVHRLLQLRLGPDLPAPATETASTTSRAATPSSPSSSRPPGRKAHSPTLARPGRGEPTRGAGRRGAARALAVAARAGPTRRSTSSARSSLASSRRSPRRPRRRRPCDARGRQRFRFTHPLLARGAYSHLACDRAQSAPRVGRRGSCPAVDGACPPPRARERPAGREPSPTRSTRRQPSRAGAARPASAAELAERAVRAHAARRRERAATGDGRRG